MSATNVHSHNRRCGVGHLPAFPFAPVEGTCGTGILPVIPLAHDQCHTSRWDVFLVAILTLTLANTGPSFAQDLAVRGRKVYTMAGDPIDNGVVLIEKGKIRTLGRADAIQIPAGANVLDADVVTPGLIDAHCTVGVSGIYNIPHDQDQLERSSPIQPELRAIDAYNPNEQLIEWVRDFGVTTIHTGHAPGELISGQTMIVKTAGNTVNDALINPTATIAATLSTEAQKREKGQSPGTRGKMMAMLRGEFLKAQDYLKKLDKADDEKRPDRDLKLEALARVLKREVPLMVTAHRVQDIANALRLAEEFNINLILDGGVESYLMIDELKEAGVPVIVHSTMIRAYGEVKNMSFETAAKLVHAGIPVAMQSSYESYVPKTRVVLFEAAMTVANGLSFNEALGLITIDAAKLLGISDRVGSLEPGKDADLALFDGDPFEYTTHCIGTVINGNVVFEGKQ